MHTVPSVRALCTHRAVPGGPDSPRHQPAPLLRGAKGLVPLQALGHRGGRGSVLGHFEPHRAGEYRWMVNEIDYSRLYGGGHYLSDVTGAPTSASCWPGKSSSPGKPSTGGHHKGRPSADPTGLDPSLRGVQLLSARG